MQVSRLLSPLENREPPKHVVRRHMWMDAFEMGFHRGLLSIYPTIREAHMWTSFIGGYLRSLYCGAARQPDLQKDNN